MKILDKIQSALNKHKIKADVFLGGSYAKGTNLETYDIDIFVRFEKNPDSDKLEKVIRSITKKYERVHGSRDYFVINKGKQKYEIVPILKIEKAEEAQNVTDVSPLHVQWVKKHLKNPNEVKKAKKFCKAARVYGAESYISGFSGYLLEILIVKYKTFNNFAKQASKWKPKTIIDISKHYKDKNELLRKLNKSKTSGPIIIVDPVDKHRNAAAAVSPEQYEKLINTCKDYLKTKSRKFFIREKFNIKNLKSKSKKLNAEFVKLKFKPKKGKEDVVNAKVVKAFNHIKTFLTNAGFNIEDSAIEFDEKIMWLIINPKELSIYQKILGPKIWMSEHNIHKFLSKYNIVDLEGDQIVAYRERKHIKLSSYIKEVKRSSYVKQKLVSLK